MVFMHVRVQSPQVHGTMHERVPKVIHNEQQHERDERVDERDRIEGPVNTGRKPRETKVAVHERNRQQATAYDERDILQT